MACYVEKTLMYATIRELPAWDFGAMQDRDGATASVFVPDLCHSAMKTGCNPCQRMQPDAKRFLDGREDNKTVSDGRGD